MTLPLAAFVLGTGFYSVSFLDNFLVAGLSFCLIMSPESFGGTLLSALRWSGFAPGLMIFCGLGGVAYFFHEPSEKTPIAGIINSLDFVFVNTFCSVEFQGDEAIG